MRGMSVPPKMQVLKPNPQCDGIWRWGLWEVIGSRGGHKGGDPMMGLVSLQEEKEIGALSVT